MFALLAALFSPGFEVTIYGFGGGLVVIVLAFYLL